MGPPGSGKGTQAKMLQKKFNLEYIGSGDLLRSRAKIKDFTGRKIGQEIGQGKRASTPVIFKIWMDKLESFKKKPKLRGFVLDGSPRTVFEAKMLDLALEWYAWKKERKVIFVRISPQESISRLTKRKICAKCGKIFPYVKGAAKINKCDKCGGPLMKRSDDELHDIKERLRWFKTDVLPTIDYYRKKKELIKINGEQPIEKVFQDILNGIKK